MQQLEQTILAQQSTPHNQQQQLQQRVQQILQQKQQLQQQIKQFQQQVEQQLAYTQHASPQVVAAGSPSLLAAAGIDTSILTSAEFELLQASQALQAVQAVQPLLASESPPLMTPLTQVTIATAHVSPLTTDNTAQDPPLLSSMDPAQIARAV